jgi:uncharacterized protein DUF4442
MRPQLDWLTLAPTAPLSRTLHRYQLMQRSLLGRWRFARAASKRTPMLGALQARFDELRVGLCRAVMHSHPRVSTVDGTIDPIAIGALAQLCASMVIEVSVPEGLRWSARGLNIEHLRDACTTAVALARLDKIDWAQPGLVGVPVTISDGLGVEVARAVVSFAVVARSD